MAEQLVANTLWDAVQFGLTSRPRVRGNNTLFGTHISAIFNHFEFLINLFLKPPLTLE